MCNLKANCDDVRHAYRLLPGRVPDTDGLGYHDGCLERSHQRGSMQTPSWRVFRNRPGLAGNAAFSPSRAPGRALRLGAFAPTSLGSIAWESRAGMKAPAFEASR